MADRRFRLLQTVFGWIGAALLAVAFLVSLHTFYFVKTALQVQGEVIALVHVESDDDGDGTWKPRVRFTAESGETLEFEPSSSSNPPSYEVGEVVRVFHSKGNPDNARLEGFFSMWGVSVIFSILGVGFLVVPVVLGIVERLSPAAPVRRGRRRGR